MAKRSRTNISFDTVEELEELRMRATFLGYPSMGAFISDQLNLKTSQFSVAEDLQKTKNNIEGQPDAQGEEEFVEEDDATEEERDDA